MDVAVVEPNASRFPWIKITITIVILLAIYLLLKPYIDQLVSMIDVIRTLFNMMIQFSSSVTKDVVDTTAVGTKTVVNKISKPKPPPTPDDSHSTVQTKGYCYIGEWKGVRSCVRVDNTPCSTKVYSTKELCENPQLR
jgi:hypothetical protein